MAAGTAPIALSPGGPAQFLLAALREGGVAGAHPHRESLAAAEWEAVVALALPQGVAPLLHQRLQAKDALAATPGALARQLEEERRTTALLNLRNYGEFKRVTGALRGAGIPMMPLKGLHLAELVYRDISLRPMSDLDILVPRDRVSDCIAVLRRLDYGSDEHIASTIAANFDTKCNFGLTNARLDTFLEVHWALDDMHGAATDPVEDIWRSAHHAKLGDAETLVMSTEFLLLHICSHLACRHSFHFSLRALCDIAEIVRMHPEIDWGAVVTHGSRHQWRRGIVAALQVAHDYLGVPVPAPTLKALGADALDPTVLADAIAQVVSSTLLPEGLFTAPTLFALSGTASLPKKAEMLWRRVFLPRAELALLYGVQVESPRLVLYYAARLRYLLSRYAAGAWALFAGDRAVAETAARHVRLQRWIAEK